VVNEWKMADKYNQVIRPKSVVSKEAVGTPGIKGRTNVYEHMCEIAKEHARLAKDRAGETIDDMRAEIKDSLISMVFAHGCLEAYINTRGYDVLRDKYSPHWDWLCKWNMVGSKLSNGHLDSIFDETEEPFRSFNELNTLRNKLLHFKGHFSDIRKTKYARTEGTINWCNCKKAEWACTVVQAMVKKLCDSVGENCPDWLKD